VLAVHDVEAAVAFSCERLGSNASSLWVNHRVTAPSPEAVSVSNSPLPLQTMTQPPQRAIPTSSTSTNKRGVAFTRELQSYDYGMREFELCDLDGNRLRFGQYLSE